MKYYTLNFAFNELSSYQRVTVSNLISEEYGVAFGDCYLSIFSIGGKKNVKNLKSKIDEYLDFCHILHFSDIVSK